MNIEGLGKMDLLILILDVFILWKMDYSNLSTFDMVVIFAVVFWVVMLGVRLYIINVRNKQ